MKNTFYLNLKAFSILCLFSLLSINASSQTYTLYGIIGDYLAAIDPVTGTATEITPLTSGFSDFSGLTYEANLDQLMAVVDRKTDPRLVSIDRCTGEISVIGFIDQSAPFLDIKLLEAMEYNPDDGLLYASGYELNPDQNWFSSRRLMTVDPLSGDATTVATISGTCQDDADAMAFTTGAKYIVDGCPFPKRLYTLDMTTGLATFIGSYDLASGAILAVDPLSGALFSTTNSGGRELYSISTTNGAETLIGSTHSASDFGGGLIVQMAFAPSIDKDGDGYTVCDGDCDDNDPNIHPGQIDICDGIDNDCDEEIDEDIDSDLISSIENLIDLIKNLVYSGDLAFNDAYSLVNQLNLVITKLNNDRILAAINLLNVINSQISALIEDGSINQEDGEMLQGIVDCLLSSLNEGMDLEALIIDNNLAAPTTETLSDLSLYPNPNKGTFSINLLNYLEQDVSITIFNTLGQSVFSIPMQKLQNPILNIDLNQHQLADGVYWLAVKSNEGQQIQMKQFVLTR